MTKAEIIITSSTDSDDWDIEVNNVSVHYLPELLGNVIADAFEDPRFNPGTEEQIHAMKVTAVHTFMNKLGLKISDLVSTNWIDVKSRKPNHSGPFICVEKQYPDRVYTDMYWDSERQMFGTRNGDGYAFITHWQEAPKFE